MSELHIDEKKRLLIEDAIKEILPDEIKIRTEVQDAGLSLFVRTDILPTTMAKDVFQMFDDIDAVLTSFLPGRQDAPRWAQAFFLGERILYGSVGGLEL